MSSASCISAILVCILRTVICGDINTKLLTTTIINISTAEYESWNSFTVRNKIVCVQQCVQGDAHTIVYDTDSSGCVCRPYPVLGLLTTAPTLPVEIMLTNSKYDRDTIFKFIVNGHD